MNPRPLLKPLRLKRSEDNGLGAKRTFLKAKFSRLVGLLTYVWQGLQIDFIGRAETTHVDQIVLLPAILALNPREAHLRPLVPVIIHCMCVYKQTTIGTV